MSSDNEADARVLRLPLLVRRADVLYFLGYPESRVPPPQIESLIEPVLGEARELARARGTYLKVPVAAARSLGLEPIDATGLVIGLVTVGGALESRVAERLRDGDATGALLLDAAGSAAAEEAADHLGAIIADTDPEDGTEAAAIDLSPDALQVRAGASRKETEPAAPVSCRISPGYGSWPLEAQRSLFERLPHERLGVSLSPAMLMVPRKSISFAMWLGADARPISGLSGCARCPLDRCRYRKSPMESKEDAL